MGKEAQGKSLHDCAEQSKLAASGAWWATQQAPSLDSREEGLPGAASQTLLCLRLLAPARSSGVLSTYGWELSCSSTPGKYLFRDLALAEEEIKATLESSRRRGCGLLCLPPRLPQQALRPAVWGQAQESLPPALVRSLGCQLFAHSVWAVILSAQSATIYGAYYVSGTVLGPGRHR